MNRKKIEKPLDNTSSVIVALLKSGDTRRKAKMAHEYEIEFKGAKVKCKSARDAVRLLRELGQDAGTPWNAADFTEFVEHLESRPRRLLAFLVAAQEAQNDETLRTFLELDGNKALAGVLSGVSKVALKLDIKPEQVYRQSTMYNQGKPVRKYWATPAFMKAANDADWPSDSDLE